MSESDSDTDPRQEILWGIGVTAVVVIAFFGGASIGYIGGSDAGFSEGNETGWSDGYDAGWADGNHSGWQDGYDEGWADGNESYEDGYEDGWADGNESGYESGWDDGYTLGYGCGSHDVATETAGDVGQAYIDLADALEQHNENEHPVGIVGQPIPQEGIDDLRSAGEDLVDLSNEPRPEDCGPVLNGSQPA